jgi:predicted Zn-dependent protease
MPMMSTTASFLAGFLAGVVLCLGHLSAAQAVGKFQDQIRPQTQTGHQTLQEPIEQQRPEDNLQKGTALTRSGKFSEAIPYLLEARASAPNQYAASFNLALCYVATGEYRRAIQILTGLSSENSRAAEVENLLAQAYIGNRQPSEAFDSLKKAAAITPQNERLYLLVADACMEGDDVTLGLEIVDLGLNNLPQSARLHYRRAVFLSQIDQFDRAKPDFEMATKVGQGSEIAYLSAAHEALLSGNIPAAIQAAGEGIHKGFQNPVLLTILGEGLIRSGAVPGEPEFSEAEAALENSVMQRPNDPASQIALGQVYLAAGRLDDAIGHLEKARAMKPRQPSTYALLAKAYQRRGDEQAAQQALATLEKLNVARAEQIRDAPGDRKMSYAGSKTDTSPDQ